MDSNIFQALLAIRKNPAVYPHFIRYLRERSEECRVAAIDPTQTADIQSLVYLQGKHSNYAEMINLFERELEQVQQSHILDEQARQ